MIGLRSFIYIYIHIYFFFSFFFLCSCSTVYLLLLGFDIPYLISHFSPLTYYFIRIVVVVVFLHLICFIYLFYILSNDTDTWV